MLNDLLFLGLVPGTNFQITFSELMVVADMALVASLLHRRHFSINQVIDRIYYYRLYFSVRFSLLRPVV
jgi:hypothetical protein